MNTQKHGLYGFQKSLHPCALEEIRLYSVGRIKPEILLFLLFHYFLFICHSGLNLEVNTLLWEPICPAPKVSYLFCHLIWEV